MSRPRKGGRGAPPQNSAAIFAALGDRTRLELVTKLSRGEPRSIAELAIGTRVTRQAITKHLRVLEKAGILSASRQGREMHFQFEPAALNQAQSYLKGVSAYWDESLARLKAFVEEQPKGSGFGR